MRLSAGDQIGRAAGRILLLFGLAIMLAPVVTTVVLSFSESFTFPPTGFTLRWYANFLGRPEFMDGLRVSLILACATVVASTALGVGIALTITRRTFPGRAALSGFVLSPITLPRVALGVALLLYFATLDFATVPLRLLILHLVVTCPYVIAAVTASLHGLNSSYEQAAMNLGASPFEVFRRITLPLIRPGLIAGALFAAVISFDEVTATVFLTDAHTTTFPVVLFSYLARGDIDPTVAAASTFMLMLVAVLVAALARYVGLARALGVARPS